MTSIPKGKTAKARGNRKLLDGGFTFKRHREMKAVYPVFFTKADTVILVEVPDLGIITEGKNMIDAIDMARDAIRSIRKQLGGM